MQFSKITKLGETYPDKQLNEDDVADRCGNVKWGTKVGIAVRQVDDRRRGMSKNQQCAADVFTRHGVKQLLSATEHIFCTLTAYVMPKPPKKQKTQWDWACYKTVFLNPVPKI